jgi:hypothetical protein
MLSSQRSHGAVFRVWFCDVAGHSAHVGSRLSRAAALRRDTLET